MFAPLVPSRFSAPQFWPEAGSPEPALPSPGPSPGNVWFGPIEDRRHIEVLDRVVTDARHRPDAEQSQVQVAAVGTGRRSEARYLRRNRRRQSAAPLDQVAWLIHCGGRRDIVVFQAGR